MASIVSWVNWRSPTAVGFPSSTPKQAAVRLTNLRRGFLKGEISRSQELWNMNMILNFFLFIFRCHPCNHDVFFHLLLVLNIFVAHWPIRLTALWIRKATPGRKYGEQLGVFEDWEAFRYCLDTYIIPSWINFETNPTCSWCCWIQTTSKGCFC